MADYRLPRPKTMVELARRFQKGLTGNAIDRFIPNDSANADMLVWSVEDELAGLQQIRGINGAPVSIPKDGKTRYMVSPAYYGEFDYVDEKDILHSATMDGNIIDVREHIAKAQEKLIFRENTRKLQLKWNLATEGAVTVNDSQGQTKYTINFNTPTFAVPVPWSTLQTATPMADIEQALLGASKLNVSWRSNATIFVNDVVATYLYGNQNPDDIGGFTAVGDSRRMGLTEVNEMFAARGLPRVEVMDTEYLDNASPAVRNKLLPDNRAIIFGNVDNGESFASYTTVNGLHKTGSGIRTAAAPWNNVDVDRKAPYNITVERGHNGGFRVYNPQACLRMTGIV